MKKNNKNKKKKKKKKKKNHNVLEFFIGDPTPTRPHGDGTANDIRKQADSQKSAKPNHSQMQSS